MGDRVTVSDMNKVLKWANRKDYLGKHMPICPICKSEQVHLRDWIPVVAAWDCRVCEHEFIYEPTE